MPRFFEEGDALCTIVGVVASEIIRLEEKEHTASTLLADSRALSIGVRSCEEKPAAVVGAVLVILGGRGTVVESC